MSLNSTSLKKLFSMKNKNALVIGGSGYLGKEMTSSLLELGANVIVASRNKKLGLQKIKQFGKKSAKIYGNSSANLFEPILILVVRSY
mgnify:CR=1 FL=1